MTRTPPSYFHDLYRSAADPWDFETSWYEQRKYAITLASLPQASYRHAFEPGCSVGILTAALAPRCERLLAMDLSPAAIAKAAERVASLHHVEVRAATIPEQWPAGPFDLLVLSEVAYYFDAGELRSLIERARGSLAPGATIIAVHWTGETDYPLTAHETHSILAEDPEWTSVVHHDDAQFVLDVWSQAPADV